MATSAASPSPLRLSAVTPGGTPPPGTVRAKISQLNASSSSIDTSSGPRSRASSVSLPGVPVTPPPATNMVSQRDTPNLSDSSHLRINTGSSIKTPRLEKDVRLVVDTRLRQHLCNLYKAEKEVSSADDVSDTEKLLAVMHSKNVNFTQEAIKIIIHLMALEENQQAIGRSVLILELIRSLSAPQDAIRTYAAWALSNFSSNESNHKAIHDVGGIKALLSLLTSSSEDSLKQALSALLNISSNPMFVETIRKGGGMREMIRLLEYSGNAADAIIPLTLMVFINLATNEKNMEMFGDVGGFPPLIKLLHHPVFSMDAMPFLIALLNNPRRVSQFIAAEGLRPLFDFVSRAPARQEGKYDNSLEHCLLALHHLLSNEDYVRMIGERNFVLPLTALLDGRQDPRILVLVVEIIDTLLDSDERNGTQLVTASGIERLVALLPAKRPKRTLTVVVDNALLLLTGLLETNDNNQEHLLDRGVVPAVAGVMSWATNETLEHALHLIALLTSGVNGQVVYDEIVKPWPQVLPRLLQMLNADPANKRAAAVPDSTRIKIALCFSALLGHIDCHMDLVELEVVGHFIDLLASPNQRLQFYAITALRNLSTYYASVRREIQHLDGLSELLALVHGPNRAAVSVARLEAMRTIANLSVTDDPIDLQEFCDTSVPVLLAVLATPPPSRDDITRAVAKRKQRLSSGSQQDPNCNKITSFEMQQVREQKKGRDGSTISTPSPHDLGSGSHSGGGNAGNAGNSGTMLVRAARLTGANSSLNTNGRGSRVSNMESLGSGDLETRIGNVGTVGSGGSRIAVNSGASISGLGSQDDQEEDRMLEERVFQTKWENDCLIKAYTAITLQNLSIEADFVDVVHSAGGLGVVMEYLLGSSSPRLQYEAVRLLTVWAAQDANRMAFQEMGGIQRLEQALAAFQSSPVPNDALIMCTQIALNTMSIPPVELSERMMSLDDDDDSGIIGWEPETAILDYMRQVEHAIRTIELSNPLESYHSHSLPTSPKDSVTKSSRYSSQPVTLRRSVRQRERFDKYQRGGIKDASIFAQPVVVNEEDKDQTKVVGWREEVGVSRLLESSGPAVVPPSRLLFDQMEEMRDRMTGKPGVGDLTSLAPLSPSRSSRPRGSRAAERREKNEDGKTSKSEAAAAKKNEDEIEIGEAEEKAPKRRGSFRQLSKQFSATLKKVHQTTKKPKTDNNPDADKGNGDDKDNKREKEKKKKKKKKSDKEKEKTRKKKEKEKEKSTKKKKKKAAKQKSSGVRGKPDGLGDGKEAYKWSVEEVGDWLEENSLGELRPVFVQHHIDGKALMQLHHAALSRMGIFSQPLSSALLQRRRKLLTRSTSLTAPPSDSSMGSSLSSSRSYPNLSSSSSSSVSVHARDKIVKDEEKRKHKKKSKDKAKAKEESGDKTERAKTKAKSKAKAKKGEGEKGEGEGAGHEQKREKRRKKGSSKKKRRKTAGNDGATDGEEGSTTTTTEAERESKVVPRKGSGDVDKKKPTAASAKPKVSSLRRRPTELSEDGKGKEKAFGEADAAGGNGGRRKELRFEGNVPDEDEESELGGTLIDDLGKGKGEELLVLRDIRISLQEERELKSAAAGAGAEGGSEHRGSGRKRGGSSTRRRKQRGRQLAAAADEETDEDHPEQQAKSPRASAGAVPRAADPLQTQTQPKQAGFLRSISTIFHIRGNKHTAKQQHDPHHLDAASSQHSTASSAVDEVGDAAAAQPAAQAGEGKKRGSWVRSAFLRRGRKGDGGGEERKNAIRRGSEEAELRNSKETARRQQKEQKQEQERKKKQDKEKAKERNKLSRKNSSLLSRMAVSTKRGNQGSKKTMTFSLEEDVNYGSTTDTTTTHSHSRGRGDEGDLHDDDDEDEMDDIRRKQGTPRVNLQRATSGDELLPLDGEGSVDHASYSETEEQEVADYSEVVHQTTMDSGSYPSTPKRGSTARPPTCQQLFSLTTARLQVITQLGPHRKRLMLDLLETERRYVALVTVLIRQFLKPLLLLTYTEQEQFLTEEELHSIFLNIGLLHSYNMIFLSNLTQRVHSWSDSQPVADVFLMLSDFLTAYGEYLHNYEAATALLQHCLQDPSFDQFVKTLAASPDCEGLGLEDFLILPYQRITAYAHIFRKLVKWTWESHADYGDITTVLHTVEKIISSNVHLRLLPSLHEKGQVSPSTPRSRYTKLSAREGFLKLLAVHDILLGCPIDITITPGRQYVCEAQVTLLDEAVNRQRGWLYLFNDALLTTTEIEIAIRKTFPLQNKDAQDFCSFIPLEDIMTIDEAREYSTIVKVTCKGGRIITIKFDSTESKSLWLDHFVVIVAAHRQKTARYNPPDGVDHLPPHYAPVPHGLASEESEFES